MGASILYQAIPLSLLETLTENKSYRILIGTLWGNPNPIFLMFDDPDARDEAEDMIDWLPEEEPDLFSSSDSVEHCLHQLDILLGEIKQQHPNIDQREAGFEKTQSLIEQLLIDDLSRHEPQVSPEQISEMIYGSTQIDSKYDLSYVSSAELTRFLPFAQTIDPTRLLANFDFGDRVPVESWYEQLHQEIGWFKDCILEAEKHQNILLIGVN